MNANADNFWQFSVTLYREPGIAETCLDLQNQHGFDVNLVLFCIWYGLARGPLPAHLLQQAIDFSSHWKQLVVQPLRETRTRMKQDPTLESLPAVSEIKALREDIKRLELNSERIQQQELQRLADNLQDTGQKEIDGNAQDKHPSEENLEKLTIAMGSAGDNCSEQFQLLVATTRRLFAV